MRFITKLVLVFGIIIFPAYSWSASDPTFQGLTLKDAERLAVERDAVIKSLDQQALAFSEQAKAADSWPDPRIKFGAQAVPIDSFDLEQEPMTQVILGYQQMLPRGDSLDAAAASLSAKSRMQLAKLNSRKRDVLMKVRHAWLDVVLQSESIRIIQANRQLFVKMLDISQSHYAAGRQQQQDVVQAELEISLVDDRLQQAASKLIVARANLAKWVGEDNLQGDVEFGIDDLQMKAVPDVQNKMQLINQHPELIAANEGIVSQQKKLDMANEQFSPQWGFDINYGKRSGENFDGSERDDFLTAMVTVDLPVFTDNKQDRNLSAEKQRLQATKYQQIDTQRVLHKRLIAIKGQLHKLNQRYKLYKNKVLPQARQNAEVSLSGYQSGVVSFFTLTRARITELNTRLSNLRIMVDYNKTYAELINLIGDEK